MVGTTENWSCTVFGHDQPNEGGERVTQTPEFWENEGQTTDSAKIQWIDTLLSQIVVLKSMMKNKILTSKISYQIIGNFVVLNRY